MSEWAETWLARLHGLKVKTVAGYESLLQSRVLPAFGGYQLRQVSASAVRAWLGSMLDEGLSPSSALQARQVLRAMLGQAVADGILVANPVERVKAPTVGPGVRRSSLRSRWMA